VSLRVEAYMVGGVLRGVVARGPHLRDVLEGVDAVDVERAVWSPLDGQPAAPAGEVRAVIDDLVLAVSEEEIPGPVHAAWHPICLEAGPYTIHGDLATMPGFDPGRALTRPTGTFVLLSGVRIALTGRPEVGETAHRQALVNRYAVDSVDADLMLGFFFPGARVVGELLRAASGEMPTPAPTPAVLPPV
jgi:hypothetical protein